MTYPPGPTNSGYTPLSPTPDTSGQFYLNQLSQTVAPRRRTIWPWIVVVILALVLATGALTWALWPEEEADPLQAGYDACQSAVLERLKAPSTAQFGGWSYHEDTVPYEIHGWVDSENTFSAMVRTRFECSVRRDGWEILNVTFEES